MQSTDPVEELSKTLKGPMPLASNLPPQLCSVNYGDLCLHLYLHIPTVCMHIYIYSPECICIYMIVYVSLCIDCFISYSLYAVSSSQTQMISIVSIFFPRSASPRKELKSAAGKLNDMAQEVTGAMGKFVDGALEAAESKLPKDLMSNVTKVLKGVQDEAMQELEPLGEVGHSSRSGGSYQYTCCHAWVYHAIFIYIYIFILFSNVAILQAEARALWVACTRQELTPASRRKFSKVLKIFSEGQPQGMDR